MFKFKRMGHTRKILSSQKIPTIPIFSSSKLVVELAENFHLHYRNYRLEMDHVEFELMARAFIKAYAHWCLRGCPESSDYEQEGDKNVFLATSQLPAMPSFANTKTNIGSTRVELQEWIDYFHIHYKDFRLEFNREEFQAFSEVVSEGYESYIKNMDANESGRRYSIHQSTVPKRIFEKNGKNGFWCSTSEIKSEKVFASTYKAEDLSKISDRISSENSVIKVDIRDLFNATMYNTKRIGTWGLDQKSIFLPLKNRYEFVKLAIKNEFTFTDEQIENTDYYRLLCVQDVSVTPRDGSSQGVYANPMEQAKYFVTLIKKIFTDGYNPCNEVGIENEKIKAEKVGMYNKTGDGYEQIRSSSSYITVTFDGGAPRIANGLHRSSIIYAMYELNLLNDPFVSVKVAGNANVSTDGSLEMIASLEENSRVMAMYFRSPLIVKFLMRIFIVSLIFPYFFMDKILQRARNLAIKIKFFFTTR